MTHREASIDDLDARTLLALLRLRVDVFVVEQACAYPDVDDADGAATTLHCWVEEDGVVLAVLRLLRATDGPQRVGRVATAPAARGRGIAAALVRSVLAAHPGPTVLEAQTHLVGWYERLGFEVAGAGYVEDGIPHTPMRLADG